MTDSLCFGIAGAGYAAHLRTRALASLASPRLRIGAVWGRNPARAAGYAAELGVPAVSSLDALCDAKGVNAVLVAVPNRLHEQVVHGALERGKHVLCEYPLVLSGMRGARALARLAEKKGLILHIGQTMNWDSDHAFVRENLARLGKLYLGYKFMSFGATGSWFSADGFAGDWQGLGDWYVTDTARGGWIVSSHYHGMQIFRRLFGEVEAVSAMDSTSDGVSAASVLLRHVSGAGTSVQWAMPARGTAFNKMIVTGSEGSIETESGRYVLEVAGKSSEGALPVVDTFARDLQVLLEEMDGTRDHEVELEDSMRTLAVALAAERAAATGREIPVRF
jgi:predicted dehydrogenase